MISVSCRSDPLAGHILLINNQLQLPELLWITVFFILLHQFVTKQKNVPTIPTFVVFTNIR